MQRRLRRPRGRGTGLLAVFLSLFRAFPRYSHAFSRAVWITKPWFSSPQHGPVPPSQSLLRCGRPGPGHLPLPAWPRIPPTHPAWPRTLTHTHTHAHSPTCTVTRAHSHSATRTLTHTHSCSLTPILTHTCTHTYSCTLPCAQPCSRAHIHTRTHTHAHTRTPPPFHTPVGLPPAGPLGPLRWAHSLPMIPQHSSALHVHGHPQTNIQNTHTTARTDPRVAVSVLGACSFPKHWRSAAQPGPGPCRTGSDLEPPLLCLAGGPGSGPGSACVHAHVRVQHCVCMCEHVRVCLCA